MRNLFVLLAFFFSFTLQAASVSSEVSLLLEKLDSLIAQKEYFVQLKESKIAHLRKQQAAVKTLEERYWLNKLFYDEYFVYNADSAMVYTEQNLALATQLNRKDWVAEWKIKKSFLLSATGLLKEAFDELQGIASHTLPPPMKVEYYSQMTYLFSHFGQYFGDDNRQLRQEYYQKETSYQDSIFVTVTSDHPLYLWYKGWSYRGSPEVATVRNELYQEVSASPLESRRDAMNAYILACLCLDAGEEEAYLKYLICSGMADVRSANKDIASLEELARALFDRGDIDHAYAYINYCLQHAQLYRNRVRVVSMARIQDAIHRAYQERILRQEARLHVFLVVVSVLSVVLLLSVCYILRQMKRLSLSRSRLNEANILLNQHVEELSNTHRQLSAANGQLQLLNAQLQEINGQLQESNYVKEEYIGYVFALCSNYISKLDDYRKTINRKIKAQQIEEVKKMTDSSTLAQSELKEFYHNFDAIFLHVYPDFVHDFNALLQPEARIVLKEGELLNTELRIYALVRLGINDSVKIADFLHCSPQTVYNNRLKTRNKSLIPKEEFARTVMALGKNPVAESR